MKSPVRYIILLLLLAGCVKEADWPMPGETPDLIVVEAFISDQRSVQTIRIAYPIANLNEIPQPVTGATVFVTTADSLWSFREDSLTPGCYLSETPFGAAQGNTYSLQILLNGTTYSAQAGIAQGLAFQELIYSRNDGGTLYHIDWVASAFSLDNPAMWEVILDWSLAPGYESADPDTCRARLCFYTLPTIDVSQIFAPIVEEISFPAGTIITERRYSMTESHAAYIRELLLETSWQGSLFPSANANLSTNLSPGATGYFAVCAVTELSLVVQ